MTPPLVPADCDLQDFQYMPLDVRRLRDSDLASLESPEACWAAVLLWSASWHQVPAASLPDDDRVLSNLAGYGRVVSEWQKVRDGALRGWIKCSDGRLYHPVVAEKAVEAWDSKQRHAHGKLKERLRKSYGKDAVSPTFEQWISAGKPSDWPQPSAGIPQCGRYVPPENGNFPPEKDDFPPETKTPSAGIPPEIALKGEGKGKGYVNLNPQAAAITQSESRTTTTDAAATAPADPIQARAIELTAMLRKRGASLQASDPRVRAWAERGISDAQAMTALDVAEQRRADKASHSPINAGLLDAIIGDIAHAPNARASPPRRQTIHEKRAETIAALTGKNRNHERTIAEPRDITAEAVRIA